MTLMVQLELLVAVLPWAFAEERVLGGPGGGGCLTPRRPSPAVGCEPGLLPELTRLRL